MTQDPHRGWNYDEHPFDAWTEANTSATILRSVPSITRGSNSLAANPEGTAPRFASSGMVPANRKEVTGLPSLARSLSRAGR